MSFVKGSENTASGDAENNAQYCFTMRSKSARSLSLSGQIEKIITKKGKKLLESVKLFDIYRNEKIGEGKKSVAYSLIFRDKNKTLSDDDINTIMDNIILELEKNLGAELRKI